MVAGQAAAPNRGPALGAPQTVGEVMSHEVPTARLDADLAEIAEQMATAELKRVTVVDVDGQAVGIILWWWTKPAARLASWTGKPYCTRWREAAGRRPSTPKLD